MARFLLVRPSYDLVTSTLHSWADDLLTSVRGSGHHSCTDLSGASATRSNTEAQLHSGIDCFVFYGHGDYESLFAQDGSKGSPACVDRVNDSLLSGKLVYVVACDSAATLGPHALGKGAEVYIGYNDLFGIVWGGPEVWFRRASNSGILFLVAAPSGATPSCDAAVNYMRSVYDFAIHYYSRGGGVGHYNYALAAAWLRWNRDSLVLLGNPGATL